MQCQCHIKQNIVSCDFHKTQKQANLNNVLYRHTHRCDKYIKDKSKGRISPEIRTMITFWEGVGKEMEALEYRSGCKFLVMSYLLGWEANSLS